MDQYIFNLAGDPDLLMVMSCIVVGLGLILLTTVRAVEEQKRSVWTLRQAACRPHAWTHDAKGLLCRKCEARPEEFTNYDESEDI